MRNFMELLRAQWAKGNFVCVGLDSELGKIPEQVVSFYREDNRSLVNAIIPFNTAIIEATKDIVCAYKPNLAFYAAHGSEGIAVLHRAFTKIHEIAPDVPIILDAKVADIGNTNNGYVQMAFDYLQADAITVHPYLGAEALAPFLDRADKGVIVLCRTSNPGAGEFQDLEVRQRDHLSHLHPEDDQWEPLYIRVARHVANEWNKNGNCALVVGATYPDELAEVRKIVGGNMPILIPGVGFQQKNVPLEKQVEQVVLAGGNVLGGGMIINSSRGIIFASKDADFAEAARRETEKLHNLINQYR
jgi:orotidine-5'-phosphate decarboxylase